MLRAVANSRAFFHAGLVAAYCFPLGWTRRIADGLGNTAWWTARASRRHALDNLSRLLGHPVEQVESLARQGFRNLGRGVADYGYCYWSQDRLNRLVPRRDGLEHLDRARAAGKGAVLVSIHLGSWEIGAALVGAHGIPVRVLTLPEGTPKSTELKSGYRSRFKNATSVIGTTPFDVIPILAALGRGELLAMLCDRVHGAEGLPVRFGKGRLEFSRAPALLAHLAGIPVLPTTVVRDSDGLYTARIGAPIPLEPVTDDRIRDEVIQENTQRIASAFEKAVLEHPDQWFNYVPLNWVDNM